MKIRDIILIILTIIAVTISLWYIFGDSPTIEQALLVLIITFLFKNQSNLIANNTEIKILKNSFIHLAKDFKEHTKYK